MPLAIPPEYGHRLHRQIETQANGSGFAQGSITPDFGTSWFIDRVSVYIPGAVAKPIAKVFMGGAKGSTDPQYFIDATFEGDLDSTDACGGYPLRYSEYLVVQWTGTDPNVNCTAIITGLWL